MHDQVRSMISCHPRGRTGEDVWHPLVLSRKSPLLKHTSLCEQTSITPWCWSCDRCWQPAGPNYPPSIADTDRHDLTRDADIAPVKGASADQQIDIVHARTLDRQSHGVRDARRCN